MDPVTVNITRIVRPGRQEAFEAALKDFLPRSLETPGQLGVQVLRPAPGGPSRQYQIIRRYSSIQARDDFYASELFQNWNALVEPLCEGEAELETVCGLETWFTLPGQSAIVPPPRWKMALVTLTGVYPATLLAGYALQPWNASWPLPLRVLANVSAVVLLLTWIVMPQLTRWLRPWLYPAR